MDYIKSLKINHKGESVEIQTSGIEYLILKEEAGGGLPTFQFCIYRTDDGQKVNRVIAENAKVTIEYLTPDLTAHTANGLIVETYVDTETGAMTIIGIHDTIEYLTESMTFALSSTSRGAIKYLPVLGKFKKIDESKYDGSDEMIWYQLGRSYRAYVANIILHAKPIPGTSLLMSLTWDEEMILATTPVAGSQEAKYCFAVEPLDSKLPVIECISASNSYTGLNSMFGNKVQVNTIPLGKTEHDTSNYEYEQQIVKSKSHWDSKRTTHHHAESDYHYPGYYQQYYENIARLGNISKFNQNLIVRLCDAPIRMLEPVQFFDTFIDIDEIPENSGDFVIIGKRMLMQGSNFEYFITIARDALSYG